MRATKKTVTTLEKLENLENCLNFYCNSKDLQRDFKEIRDNVIQLSDCSKTHNAKIAKAVVNRRLEQCNMNFWARLTNGVKFIIWGRV